MAQLVPEKTVEMWTALAAVNGFGNRASVYTRGGDAEHAVWPQDLRQLFVLEPRAPEVAPSSDKTGAEHGASGGIDPDMCVPCYRINRRQLLRFMWWYANEQVPEIFYVFPDPRKRPRSPTDGSLLPLGHPEVIEAFPQWARAIRAGSLEKLIKIRKVGQWARVYWAEDVDYFENPIPGSLCYRPRQGVRPRIVGTRPLDGLLEEIAKAEEPPGVTMRASTLYSETPTARQPPEFGHADIAITPEALLTVQRLINDPHAGFPLLVGVHWKADDPLRFPKGRRRQEMPSGRRDTGP